MKHFGVKDKFLFFIKITSKMTVPFSLGISKAEKSKVRLRGDRSVGKSPCCPSLRTWAESLEGKQKAGHGCTCNPSAEGKGEDRVISGTCWLISSLASGSARGHVLRD